MQATVRNHETAFAELVKRKEDLKRVFTGISKALSISFEQDKKEHPLSFVITDAAIKERFSICEKWFRIMRGDCGYSVDRAVDYLPVALRTELDGGQFEPPKTEVSWSPDVLSKV
jgi:hypothetical protein